MEPNPLRSRESADRVRDLISVTDGGIVPLAHTIPPNPILQSPMRLSLVARTFFECPRPRSIAA